MPEPERGLPERRLHPQLSRQRGAPREWRPDIIISGHQHAMYTDDDFFRLLTWWGDEFESIHRAATVLGDDEAHFDADGWGGWIWPYRVHVAEGETVRVTVTVRNPLPETARLTVRLVGPEGWEGERHRRSTRARGPRSPAR